MAGRLLTHSKCCCNKAEDEAEMTCDLQLLYGEQQVCLSCTSSECWYFNVHIMLHG